MTKEKTKIIGIDLSLTGTGIVVLEDGKLMKKKLIKSKPLGKRPIDEIHRIRKIIEEIEDILGEDIPDIAVIEGMAFMARNTTALVQLAALNYMTRALLVDYNITFIIVAPTSLKKFVTGSGNAKKDVMLIETYKRYGVTILDDNICDGYSLAQVGLCLKESNSKPVTKFQQEVLDLLKKQL